MHETGTHLFPAMDRVVFGKPLAETIVAEATRLKKDRVFLIVSRTLNTQTDAIACRSLAIAASACSTGCHSTRRAKS